MGTDIHLHTEVKINGKWEHYSYPHIERKYALFSFMADVRNTHPNDKDYILPLSKPKGLPENLSVVTVLDYEKKKTDNHSMSWLNDVEIALLEKWMEINSTSIVWEFEHWGFLFGNSWAGFHNWKEHPEEYDDYPDEYPPKIEDIRFVFWFD
jgi:hypothetical protein